MVIVKDIEFFSLSNTTSSTSSGRAHVAYIPNGKVVGAVEDPEAGGDVRQALAGAGAPHHHAGGNVERVLRPKGVAVVIEAIHLCMMMRGVEPEVLRDRELHPR